MLRFMTDNKSGMFALLADTFTRGFTTMRIIIQHINVKLSLQLFM